MKGKIRLIVLCFLLSNVNLEAQEIKKDSSTFDLGKFNLGFDGLTILQSVILKSTKAFGVVANYQFTSKVGIQTTISYYDVGNNFFGGGADLVRNLNYKTLNWGAAIILTDKPENQITQKKVKTYFFKGFGFNYSQNSIYYEGRVYDKFSNFIDIPVNLNLNQLTIHAILGLGIIKKDKFRVNFFSKIGIDKNLIKTEEYIPSNSFPGNGYSIGQINFGIGMNMFFKVF